MNQTSRRRPGSLATSYLVLVLALGLAWACSTSNSDRRRFVVNDTGGTISGMTPLVVDDQWLVYFASEGLTGGGGTILNGDGDTFDDVACAVLMTKRREFMLGVAAQDAAVLAGQIYLDVDETIDGRDWNVPPNGVGDRVLLHWNSSTGTGPTFVETLDPAATGPAFVATDDRVYYAADPSFLMVGEPSLRSLSRSDPMTPVPVANAGGADHAPTILELENSLLFLRIDETVDWIDRNGDLDFADTNVLGLLDTTDPNAEVVNVGLAMDPANQPFDTFRDTNGDWLVAFLVDEMDQDATNLNDPTLPEFASGLVPATCAGSPDTDTLDQVLHYLNFFDFVAGMSPAVNTGLVGRDRVLAVDDFVATLSLESDAECNLNEDADGGTGVDFVARWVETMLPVAPPRDASSMRAVDTTIPGGALGFAKLSNRFIAVVDEAQDGGDIDGKAPDHDLVAWLDPLDGAGALWNFSHQDPQRSRFGTGIFEDVDGDGLGDPDKGASEPFAGTSWMGAESRLGRLPVTFLEAVPGLNPRVGSLNNNIDCAFVAKDNDVTDALPVWLDFDAGDVLDFDGVGFAVDSANAGLVVAGFTVFFRVVEAEDSIDYNRDGVLDDVVLMRNPISSCNPRAMATASTLPGDVVATDGNFGAAFVSDESAEGVDWNGDGDADDLVVRYFEL